MYHGIINVYKEAGFTSHDVVAKLRGICKQKKIGHTGTLDPDAVGVLPVCLGNGTRLCDMLTDRTKEYVARLRLGIVTDTQDASGTILRESKVEVSPEEVRRVIASFVGDSMQVPPMYSALKVNGQKLDELARQGREVEREARPVSIYALEILEEAYPEYTIRVECSKGTYIRTLCHDIGQKLGCGGIMVHLERTRVGEFEIGQAYTLEQLQILSDKGQLDGVVVPVEKMFDSLPALRVKSGAMKALKNGNPLKAAELETEEENTLSDEIADGSQNRIYGNGHIFYGVYEYRKERGLFYPVKMFLPEQNCKD